MVGSGGSGESTALAPRMRNTWSREGHWPFDAASRIGWKLMCENRESVRSSRPTSQNSPRTSLLLGAPGESRQNTKTGFAVFASRIRLPAASTSRRTTICLPWKKTGAATRASAVLARRVGDWAYSVVLRVLKVLMVLRVLVLRVLRVLRVLVLRVLMVPVLNATVSTDSTKATLRTISTGTLRTFSTLSTRTFSTFRTLSTLTRVSSERRARE